MSYHEGRPPMLENHCAESSNRLCFGKRIRSRREELNIKLKDLAKVLGVSSSYLSAVELGKRPPFRKDRLFKLCSALDLCIEGTKVLASLWCGGGFLDYKISEVHAQVGAVLIHYWEKLDQNELSELQHMMMAVQNRYRTR